MREKEGVEEPVCEHARNRGYIVRKLAWLGRRGGPDRFFAGKGKLFLVEFKAPGEVPAPHQEREIRKLRAAGVTVYVIDNEAAGRALFD